MKAIMCFFKLFLYLTEKSGIRTLILHRIAPLFIRQSVAFFGAFDWWWLRRITELAGTLLFSLVSISTDPAIHPSYRKIFRFYFLNFLNAWKVQEDYRKGGGLPLDWMVEITKRCNLKCLGCYQNSSDIGPDVSFETLRYLLKEVRKSGARLVTFSGGEPLLRWDDISRLAREYHDLIFMIYTNGTLLTQEVIAEMISVENVFPCLSIEGFKEETDKRRGQGIFDLVMKSVERLRGAGIPFGFSVTVNRFNVETICKDEFVQFCLARGAKILWLCHYMPIGRDADINLMLSVTQRGLLADAVSGWRRKQLSVMIIDTFNDGWAGGDKEGCMAGRKQGCIDSSGNILPCFLCRLVDPELNIIKICSGTSTYQTISEGILKSALFGVLREQQKKILGFRDPTSPCLVADHPEIFFQMLDSLSNIEDLTGLRNISEGLIKHAKCWRYRKPREKYLRGGPYA
ncbi:MAG: radical SAM protein [Candidatus Pacebacteria bacterium]|nr:radical SAM protein [Candidatus Paceibacterota bacterium]